MSAPGTIRSRAGASRRRSQTRTANGGSRPFHLVDTPIERGATLIEASAGTGKTYCLAGVVLRLLLERHVAGVGELLVVTFTLKATAELVERIRATLRAAVRVFSGDTTGANPFLLALRERHADTGLDILRGALRDLDDLEVCTIHGFCRRVLDQNAFETGTPFDTETVENAEPLIERAAQELWRRTVYPAGDLVAAVAARRGWSPTSFSRDYDACRAHPDVTIEPEPRALRDAVARLEDAARDVCAHWNEEAVRAAIVNQRYKSKREFGADELTLHVTALRAFCTAGRTAAVGAVLGTCKAALCKRLTDKGVREFATFAFGEACDRFAAACEELEHCLRSVFVRDIEPMLEAELHAENVVGFDDLLRRLHRALVDPVRRAALQRTAGRHFAAVLIDEFQDTDTIQFEIFRELFPDTLRFFIGDPKQAIYAFRGADVFAYIRAKKDATHRYTLDRNWRSAKPLVEAVSRVFGRSDRPFLFAEIPFERVEAAARRDAKTIGGDARASFEWIWIGEHPNKDQGTVAACGAVASEIAALVSPSSGTRIESRREDASTREPVLPRHIAVLVRTNDQAQEVQTALLAAGVPAVVSQAGNVFDTDEAYELLTLLLAVASPRDEAAVRGALATRAWACDAAAIARLADDDQAWQRHVDALEELRSDWNQKSFVTMAQRLLTLSRARENLLGSAHGARRLTNLAHLIELAQHASAEHHLSPDASIAWLARALRSTRPQGEVAELRLETDADAVQILTIHKSKGLEYEIVFCPFLWGGRGGKAEPPFLVHDGDGHVVYHCAEPPEEGRAHAYLDEDMSEETRLAYVALTRAKLRCYVAWGRVGAAPQSSALARLLHDGNGADGSRAAGWRAELEALCAASGGAMGVHDAATEASRSVVDRREPARVLAAREFPARARKQLVPWRVASFSSFRLSADDDPRTGRTFTVATPTGEQPDHLDPALPSPPRETVAGGMFAFAKGARAGTCLHEVLERCDFKRTRDEATKRVVAQALARHGLEQPGAHDGVIDPAAIVSAMVDDVAQSALPGAGFRLAAVAREARLNEWQFYVPMARLSQARLADCLEQHDSAAIAATYTAALRKLGEREVEGFLMGFVDLVFTHGGRWFLIDWKSNHLGATLEDYGAASIARAMREHHYVLQYHLYALALHRYLRQRLPSYDYARHFGGVYYCFLRAVSARDDKGWYFDRPPFAVIAALDAMIEGSGTA